MTVRSSGRRWAVVDLPERVEELVHAAGMCAGVFERTVPVPETERYSVAWDPERTHTGPIDAPYPDAVWVCSPRELVEGVFSPVDSEWYLVDIDDTAAVLELAAAMPGDVTLDVDSLTSPFGVVAFSEQVLSPGADGEDCPLHAVVWAVLPDRRLYIGFFAEMADTVTPVGFSVWSHGVSVDSTYEADGSVASHSWDRRFLSAVWALANRDATSSPAVVDRATRRRARRNGRDVPPVRLVHPGRGAVSNRGEGSGEAAVGHWWVRAHWRSQPYGPNRMFRRPVLIAAHLAGNREGPDVSRRRVTRVSGGGERCDEFTEGDGSS